MEILQGNRYGKREIERATQLLIESYNQSLSLILLWQMAYQNTILATFTHIIGLCLIMVWSGLQKTARKKLV